MAETTDILIIGAGPAGLIAAEVLAEAGHQVMVADAMPSAGRKFLLAGRGGLNLTHSEGVDTFLGRYREAEQHLAPLIDAFSPLDLIDWCESLGQPTFTGTSGRVFPKSFKTSPVLRAWLTRLSDLSVRFDFRHRWIGWTEDRSARFMTPDGERQIAAKATLLALGGASWARMGSDGAWVDLLRTDGIVVNSLKPANMGVKVSWSEIMVSRFAGEPIKRAALTLGDETVRGEAIVTRGGLEGGAIYALSALIREKVLKDGSARVMIDLRPDLPQAVIEQKLAQPRGKASQATFLHRAAGLAPIGIALMREATGGPLPLDPKALAALIKSVPLTVTGIEGIERAISSAGGVDFAQLTPDLMVKARPGLFVAGEMLDWEAPTGGYLLQASFATGVAAARGISRFLGHS
jgi:uncharacterized flavoprotein (TIGR03862 family)